METHIREEEPESLTNGHAKGNIFPESEELIHFESGKIVLESIDESCSVTCGTESLSSDWSNSSRDFSFANMHEEDIHLSHEVLISTRKKKKVAFTTVDVKEYGQTLGDHPSCSSGAPITLSWDCVNIFSMPIDEYESLHPHRYRFKSQMHLNYYQRKNTLIWCYGHTNKELQESAKTVSTIKRQRAQTVQFLSFSGFERLLESSCRKLKRIANKRDSNPRRICASSA
eukprot:scaffold38823_cov48-Attheya_sp.AAC.4